MFRRHRRATSASESSGQAPTPGPAAIAVIDDDSFFDATAGGVTVVDFWAPWCAPCRSFAPVFEQAASRHEGRVAFGKCNADVSPRTAELLGIQSIPTLVVFGPDGSELGRVAGVLPPRQLDALIERLAPGTSA